MLKMKMKKFNRKGDILGSEVLKIVLAAISIIALVYLAVVMFGLLKSKTQVEQARSTLDEMMSKIESLKEGENAEYLYITPKDWEIVLYGEFDKRPVSCSGKDCICLCSGFEVEDCQKEGVCRESKIKMDIPLSSVIISKINHLKMDRTPYTLYLTNNKGVIDFSITKVSNIERDLFGSFLSYKSPFMAIGEATFEEQILSYVNSGQWGRSITLAETFKGDKTMREELIENVQNYFIDYHFPIWVKLREEGRVTSILAIEAGKEREGSEPIPTWPSLTIKNTGKKDILIGFDWRR